MITHGYSSDVDECTTSQPCKNGATCKNTHGGSICKCTSGYKGSNCETGKMLPLINKKLIQLNSSPISSCSGGMPSVTADALVTFLIGLNIAPRGI